MTQAHSNVPMQSIPVEGPFDRVCVDILGTLPASDLGNRYVVVFTDSLPKLPGAFAIKTAGADVTVQLFVEEIVDTELLAHCCLIEKKISWQISSKKFVIFFQ